jgi:hypothetical protein
LNWYDPYKKGDDRFTPYNAAKQSRKHIKQSPWIMLMTYFSWMKRVAMKLLEIAKNKLDQAE